MNHALWAAPFATTFVLLNVRWGAFIWSWLSGTASCIPGFIVTLTIRNHFYSLYSVETKLHNLASKFPSPFSDTFGTTVAYYLTNGLSPSL